MRCFAEVCHHRNAGGKLGLSMREVLQNIQFIGMGDHPSFPKMSAEQLL